MVNGCGVESSSKVYGLFQHICVRYELITTSGELVIADQVSWLSQLQATARKIACLE